MSQIRSISSLANCNRCSHLSHLWEGEWKCTVMLLSISCWYKWVRLKLSGKVFIDWNNYVTKFVQIHNHKFIYAIDCWWPMYSILHVSWLRRQFYTFTVMHLYTCIHILQNRYIHQPPILLVGQACWPSKCSLA